MGGKFHLKLNIGERPIANKYREGKMKRTLKRELKVLEIAKKEAMEPSNACCNSYLTGVVVGCVVRKATSFAAASVEVLLQLAVRVN